jgi:hypothetical protein
MITALLYGKGGGPKLRGLCCKNSLPNVADVEDYILLCLDSHSKQGGDEYHLTPDISFLHTVYLSLSHHIHRFVSLQRSPCRFKREEAKSWFDRPFDEAMILLDNSVEVLDLPQFTSLERASLGFQLVQSFGIGGVFIHRNHAGCVAKTQERYDGREVSLPVVLRQPVQTGWQ